GLSSLPSSQPFCLSNSTAIESGLPNSTARVMSTPPAYAILTFAHNFRLRRNIVPSRKSGSQQTIDLLDQFPRRERFGDIKIYAGRDASVDLGVTPLGGKHDDLDMPPFGPLPDPLAHFVAAA